MDFLLWTCLVLGLIGAIAMAISGMGLDHADAVSTLDFDGFEALDAADAADVLDIADAFDVTDAMDASDALDGVDALDAADVADHLESALPVHADAVHDIELARLTDLLDQAGMRHVDQSSGGRLPAQHEARPEPVGARVGPFSSFTIFSFLSTFGAMGLMLRRVMPTWGEFGILGTAFFSGWVLAFILYTVLNKVLGAIESDSLRSESEAMGRLAEVTNHMPPNAFGEVVYVIRGSRLTSPAKNISQREIRRGSKVRLGARDDAVYLVEPLSAREVEYLAVLAEIDTQLAQPDPLAEDPPLQVQ